MPKSGKAAPRKYALVVHPDMGVLSQLQAELTKSDVTAILARDLPSALLAITQHFFDLALLPSKIVEEGDGWPLAGVLRLVFPNIYMNMMVPNSDLLTLRSAINNGVDEILDQTTPSEGIARALLNPGLGQQSGTVQ